MLDLGALPLSDVFPTPAEADDVERAALHVAVCTTCWWMQLADDTPDEPDAGGPPATETSPTIRAHAVDLVGWLISEQLVPPGGRILELASHGNVLAGFLHERGLTDTTTVERHSSALAAARSSGLRVVDGRLDAALAGKLAADRPFDLVLDTFDLAHRRAPGHELAGIATAIGERGVAVIEVEHALPVLEGARFDSVRHGHFAYPSLLGLRTAAQRAGLDVTAALRTSIYGGGLRVVLARRNARAIDPGVERLLAEETEAGLASVSAYDAFALRVAGAIEALRAHLVAARAAGRLVAGYGAPSRGSTLVNAARIDRQLLPFTADVSAAKHGREIPGARIPIVDPAELVRRRPDEVLILTWTIADEVVEQLRAAGLRDCQFVVPLPELRVIGT